ncbi:MAG: fimbria/pilus periplasmic chaperone [Pseudomonadota bacterium]
MSRHHWFSFFAIVLGAITLSGATVPAAQAQFVLEPLRAVLDEDTREAEFTILNTADRLLQVNVSMLDLEATLEGYRPAAPAHRAAISAAPWLTLYPATLSLEPGARQKIRVRLRARSSQAIGHERRTHLYVEAGPPRAGIRKVSDTGIGLDLSVGVSVPVLVRPASIAAPASVVSTEGAIRFAETTLVRAEDGSILLSSLLAPAHDGLASKKAPQRSVYGAVCVAGPSLPAPACLQNIALYPDAPGRRVSVDLKTEALFPGTYHLTYKGRAEDAGQTLAAEDFRIK